MRQNAARVDADLFVHFRGWFLLTDFDEGRELNLLTPRSGRRYGFIRWTVLIWHSFRFRRKIAAEKLKKMDDLKQNEHSELAAAKTQELPAFRPSGEQDDEHVRALEERIKGMIASDSPLSLILSSLVLQIEARFPEMVCSVLLIGYDGNHIRHVVAPSLPEHYVKAIDGGPIGPKHGSCGTAMFRGRPVIVRDILTDPLWEDYREYAVAIGMRACWSTPIMSSRGKVLGSFAMYYREPRTPTDEESRFTNVATKLAGLAIEHYASHSES